MEIPNEHTERLSQKAREYDIYNGVTQDMWFKGMVVAKHPK